MRLKRRTAGVTAVLVLLTLAPVLAAITVMACQLGARPIATRAAVPAASSALERHSPVLRYAEGERWFSVSPAALAQHRDATLRRGGPDGAVLERGTLSLDDLGPRHYADGQPAGHQDTISVARDRGGWVERSADLRAYEDVVYGRAVQGRDNHTYLQYWMFHVYNDSLPCQGRSGAIGDHEGDWELTQVKLDAAGKRPESVTVSQHKGHERRRWRDVETLDGHPVIYPGLGTHAGAFEPGCHWAATDVPERGAAPDCNDGGGRQVLPRLQRLEARWATWPGRWGTIAAPCTTTRWHDPAAFAS